MEEISAICDPSVTTTENDICNFFDTSNEILTNKQIHSLARYVCENNFSKATEILITKYGLVLWALRPLVVHMIKNDRFADIKIHLFDKWFDRKEEYVDLYRRFIDFSISANKMNVVKYLLDNHDCQIHEMLRKLKHIDQGYFLKQCIKPESLPIAQLFIVYDQPQKPDCHCFDPRYMKMSFELLENAVKHGNQELFELLVRTFVLTRNQLDQTVLNICLNRKPEFFKIFVRNKQPYHKILLHNPHITDKIMEFIIRHDDRTMFRLIAGAELNRANIKQIVYKLKPYMEIRQELFRILVNTSFDVRFLLVSSIKLSDLQMVQIIFEKTFIVEQKRIALILANHQKQKNDKYIADLIRIFDHCEWTEKQTIQIKIENKKLDKIIDYVTKVAT